MAWLIRDGQVLASCLLVGRGADRAGDRASGENEVHVVLRSPARLAHSLRASRPLDVAFLDASGVVLALMRLGPHRLGGTCRGARAVLEADAGAFERWGLEPGDALETRH